MLDDPVRAVSYIGLWGLDCGKARRGKSAIVSNPADRRRVDRIRARQKSSLACVAVAYRRARAAGALRSVSRVLCSIEGLRSIDAGAARASIPDTRATLAYPPTAR
jgi:hypothetical protein